MYVCKYIDFSSVVPTPSHFLFANEKVFIKNDICSKGDFFYKLGVTYFILIYPCIDFKPCITLVYKI